MNIKQIVSQLTLEQKAALLSGATTFDTFGIRKLGIPSLAMSDGPSGLRKQEGAADNLGLNGSIPATCFPSGSTLANSWDPAVSTAVGQALGEESQANEVQVILGPAMNIQKNPLSGRNFEYYSEDPLLAGRMAAGYIRGVQATGTVATPKHFAVNNQELRRMASNSVVDQRALHELYLTAFEIAVKEGHPKALMSSYNMINGTYANENRALLQETLRDSWGFDGFVVSDWGGDNDHVAGVKAGSHMAMPGSGMVAPQELIDAVKAGKLDESVLNQRVGEFLAVAMAAKEKSTPEKPNFAAHHETARKAAAASMVLLKNDQAILPLGAKTRVAIIGDFAQKPRYQGAGSSAVNAVHVENFVDTAAKVLNVVGYEKGFDRNGKADEHLIQEAKALATESDVAVVFIGLNEAQESEGKDRDSMALPDNQVALLEALANLKTSVVAVLSAGAPVTTAWAKDVDGLIYQGLTGEAGASALCDVLLGKLNPSGKLAETLPISYQDVPFGQDFPCQDANALYRESLYVGYRYYDTVSKPVAFPFGFGLSYTQFEYSAMSIDDAGAHFTLRNIGAKTGAEVAQLYVKSPDQNLYHPVHELKGFTKVTLAPGEQQLVTIPFDAYTFRAWDPHKEQWCQPAGEYQCFVGGSSRKLPLQGGFKVSGTVPDPQTDLPHYMSGQVTEASEAEVSRLLNLDENAVKTATDGLTINSTIGEMSHAKNVIARLVARTLRRKLDRLAAKGESSLNVLFIYNMPFRGIAKMTNGAIDQRMVDGLVVAVNGHAFRGLHRVISGYFANRRRSKALARKLGEQDCE
ncbi:MULTISPECIES: glycoside hydrolase family 3 C-terminal domain-containing protein [unclassified Lacticaseibacillus]|uniref:glycoside hydrolase family 3 C-terminal domain-containing protein n=1 Tax=unclassified Lacticaseibacillus TaxID=2759744 RepID=UPI00194498CC|nr:MULTISPECIES: glycoside hydrolase family 3 C-terminal domain-containing protein [unclassified Lacticaseibacillus]